MTHNSLACAEFSKPYSYYVEKAGPAPAGWRWLEENEKVEKGDMQASWGETFDPVPDYRIGEGGSGYLPHIRKVEPKMIAPLKWEIAYKDNNLSVFKISEQKVRTSTKITLPQGNLFHFYFFQSGSSSYDPSRTTLQVSSKDMVSLAVGDNYASDVEFALREYVKKFSVPEAPPRKVTFHYKGGSYNGFRTIEVSEETPEHIKGVDLATSSFKSFRKDKIVGAILEIKA